MKILIVSDNHQDHEIIQTIALKHQDADIFLHAGDSEMMEQELYPFISVKGNNDYLIETPYRCIAVPGGRIYLTHGHQELANNLLYYHAKKNDCNIIIHGHTHRSACFQKENFLVICPGALHYPRGENRKYAVLIIDDQTYQRKVTFFEVEDEV